MLAWMGLTTAIIHLAHKGSPSEMAAFSVVQVLCFSAGSMEAGAVESEKAVRGSHPARVIATLAALGYLTLVIFQQKL